MITLIEALGYRCLCDTRQPLKSFQVLVGPNASGKTTFLDVVGFLANVVSDGLEGAIQRRTTNPLDLTWGRSGDRFELAIEARLPDSVRRTLHDQSWDTIRYEVGVRVAPEIEFLVERVQVLKRPEEPPRQRDLFPAWRSPRDTLIGPKKAPQGRTVVNKVAGGNDNFYSETYKEAGKGWAVSYKLGRKKSALGNLPEDESQFPAATWLKGILSTGVQQFALNSSAMRLASAPGHGRGFDPDGSNLPWVVAQLEGYAKSPSHPDATRLADWVSHLRTALPDLEGIRTVERPDDRHRYLMLRYANSLEVPSWMASDGTLRLLALTLPAYLLDLDGIYLIEEPENGIHPRAIETMFQSLSSVYGAQILLATHSPVVLNLVDANDVLCFAKDSAGGTDIVTGSAHPTLRSWQGESSLGELLATGILG